MIEYEKRGKKGEVGKWRSRNMAIAGLLLCGGAVRAGIRARDARANMKSTLRP